MKKRKEHKVLKKKKREKSQGNLLSFIQKSKKVNLILLLKFSLQKAEFE